MRELRVAATVAAWIVIALALDRDGGLARQRALGAATWLILLLLLAGQPRGVRAQVAVVVVLATAVEYTASPLLGLYTYRLGNVPVFVPPGHGMVYLAALSLGRCALLNRRHRWAVGAALLAGGGWALLGLVGPGRGDVFGALLFAGLAGFLLAGRAPLVYVGAFAVTSYLELVGTGLGAWTWAARDPTGLLSVGNPPSGIPAGYCVLDAAALWLAPLLERGLRQAGVQVRRWRPRERTVGAYR